MLKSRYDAVFWGKTPWSLIHALLLCAKKDVLVIDDENLFTSKSSRFLTKLEFQGLQDFCSSHRATEDLNLEDFTSMASLKVHTPSFQWITGASYRDNLREFVRKFACFQTPLLLETIQKDEDTIAAEISQAQKNFLEWFSSPSLKGHSSHIPGVSWLAEFQNTLIEELNRPYAQSQDNQLAQLVTAFTAATSPVLKYTFAAQEATYLSLRLLSPVLELDHHWFERELGRKLVASGGFVKRCGVQSWRIWKNQVEAALLDSYEGVVGLNKLYLYGLPQDSSTLQCHFKEKMFREISYVWGHDLSTLMDETKRELVSMTGPAFMGTEIPVVFVEETSDATHLRVLVEEGRATKPEFYQSAAFEMARPLAQRSLSKDSQWWESGKFRSDWSLWLEEATIEDHRPKVNMHERRHLKIVDRVDQQPLKGVDTWGALRMQRFGYLGHLTDLRWELG